MCNCLCATESYFSVYSMLNCWHVINQCTTTSRSIIPDIIAKNAFLVVSIFRMFSFFRVQDIFFSNQANLNLLLTVLSLSFTIDSSFFSKVFILNSIWKKNFQGYYTQLTSFNWYNTYTIRLSIDSETSMRYAFPVRLNNFLLWLVQNTCELL